MKKIKITLKPLLVLLLMFNASVSVSAQNNLDAPWMSDVSHKNKSNKDYGLRFNEVVNVFNEYWKDKDYAEKGSGHKPFMRWKEFHQNSLLPDGTLPTPSFLWEIWEQKQQMESAQKMAVSSWIPIGPFDHNPDNSWSPGQGRINVGIVDPNNANILYVGAPAGGIWKSIDSGEHWEPLSDYLPQIGVSGIAIDYNNSDIIYISTGDDDSRDAFGIGVLKSIDGGSTWSQTGLEVPGRFNTGNDIYIDPNNSNTLWVATSNGLYKTTDAGVSWVKTLNGRIKDVKLKPGDSNVIYAAAPSTFYKSTDGGNNFVQVKNGLPDGTTRIVIDVTPADPEYVYVLCAGSGFVYQGLYRSKDSGVSFSKTQEDKNIFESRQAYYDLALAVSDQDPDMVFVGCLNVWKSTDGGDNFSKINSWSNPQQATYTHADIHFLRYYDGKLLCGSDGGIYVSDNNGDEFVDLTEGLQIGQFYKISVAENSSADHLVGGLQDNGGYALDGSQWNVYHGADGMDCAVKGNDDNMYYGFIQYGRQLYETTNRGSSRRRVAFGPEQGNWVTPLVSAKDGALYAGYSSFYKLEGGSFVKQTEFDFGSGNITKIELDPSDVNIIYAAKGNRLYRSMDKGVNWSMVSSLPRFISAIEVHNDNSNIVYITLEGSSSNTVFRSTDQGVNFLDISGNLPNEGKFTIKHHKGTESIYVGTYLGVYHKDGDQPWSNYSAGLPNVAVRDLEINLKDNMLLAGTYGRGIWKVPLQIEVAEDDIAPSVPTGVIVSEIGQTSVSLSWNASTDNIAVTGYDVYNGEEFMKSVVTTEVSITGLSSGASYEFKVVAKDKKGNQSMPSEFVEVTTDGVTEIEVNFYRSSGWSDQVNVYFFSAASNSTLLETNEWPGQQMNVYPSTNWFTYTLRLAPGVSVHDIRMVFNAQGNQTGDLSRTTNGWYFNGVWSDECSVDCDGLSLTPVDIYFKKPNNNWFGSSNIYVFDKRRNITLENTAGWPGQTMSEIDGSQWSEWSFVIPNGVSSDDIGIVFNNGSTSQTEDLTRGTTGWFTTTYVNGNGKFEGFWSDSCPAFCNSAPIQQVEDNSSEQIGKAFIAPNPINGQSLLRLQTSTDGVLQITAVNVLGQKQVIYNQKVVSGEQTIMLNRNQVNAKGIYFYVITVDGMKLDTIKVVVQ